jgi:hypothetical protein
MTFLCLRFFQFHQPGGESPEMFFGLNPVGCLNPFEEFAVSSVHFSCYFLIAIN